MTYDTQATRSEFARFLKGIICEQLVFDDGLSVGELHDAIFVPPRSVGIIGGLYPTDSSPCLRGSTLYRDISADRPPDNLFHAVTTDTRPSLYLGVVHSCWGHTITDSIKFFWPLLHPERHPFLMTCQFVYAPLVPDKGLSDNMRKIMSALGLDLGRLVEVRTPTRFSTLYFPQEAFWRESSRNRCYCSTEYLDLINRLSSRIRPSQKGTHPKKVYFTRTGWPCGDYGEKSVEQAFMSAGYEVFRPECLSLERQIELLQHADSFAATEGSCAHNALFLRPGSQLVVLRKYSLPNAYQLVINAAKDLRVVYVDSYLSFPCLWENPFNRSRGPNFLFVNHALSRFLGIGKPFFPIITFLHYLYAGLRARFRRH